MVKQIPEIEDTLRLCIEIGKNYAVIPVNKIEKHFPAERLPAYPNVPAYNLGKLTDWATEKGWSVIPEDTFSTNGRKIPGMKFTRLGKDSVPNAAQKPPIEHTKGEHRWYQKPIGIIGIGVIIATLSLFVAHIIKTQLGIGP